MNLLIAAAACFGLTRDSALRDLKKMIQSPDKEVRAKAYKEISGLEANDRENVLRFLLSEQEKCVRTFEREAKKFEAVISDYEKGLERNDALYLEWEKAAVQAMLIIFDTAVFPDPPGPVDRPYTGYYEVMDKIEPARDLYSKLCAAVKNDLKRLRAMSRTDGKKTRDALLLAKGRAVELDEQLEKHGREPIGICAMPRFAWGMLFLKCGDFNDAAELFIGNSTEADIKDTKKAGTGEKENEPETEDEAGKEKEFCAVEPNPAFSGYERFLFFSLYASFVDEYNLKINVPSSKQDRLAVAKNNDYRVSLGLNPLQIHQKLTSAITEHIMTSTEMTHFGTTPETWTVGQRVQKAGYKAVGGAAENLSTSSVTTAMDHWKWDGGHHRVLAQPGADHIGVYGKDRCGMNIATGERTAIPVLECIKHFRGE